MPTGKPHASYSQLTFDICCFAALALAFSAVVKNEEDAICIQTGQTAFQIVNVHTPTKPVVLWDAKGRYDHTDGVEDHKLVRAFIDGNVDSTFRVAEMNFGTGRCSISNPGWYEDPHQITKYYKLERHP